MSRPQGGEEVEGEGEREVENDERRYAQRGERRKKGRQMSEGIRQAGEWKKKRKREKVRRETSDDGNAQEHSLYENEIFHHMLLHSIIKGPTD